MNYGASKLLSVGIKSFLVTVLFSFGARGANAVVITGVIRSLGTGDPVPVVTIRVEGTGRSMLSNDQGQYRLVLESGNYRLKFSHVAHYSEYREVHVSDSELILDIVLREALIHIPGTKVYGRAYDPAQRIIVEAIARKQDILTQLHGYRCDAYAKMVVRNEGGNDSKTIDYILESQLECFWEQPDNYKEVIVARRQSSNLKAGQNLTNIEQIPNFNSNRITFDRYLIVSPTATDALKYYNYYLMDTILVDNQVIFRLEVEPKNEIDPLMAGTIDIADSTFNVVGVEGGLGAGVYIPFVKDFHYSQRFAEFEGRYWMPIDIHMDYTLATTFPIEQELTINHVAVLNNYNFVDSLPTGTFDYALEVSREADRDDSVIWNALQVIPLTLAEKWGYERIDSLVNAPKSLYKNALSKLLFVYMKTFNYNFFHFNRVEGAYLGIGHYWFGPTPSTEFDITIGYAFSGEYWQHRYGFYYHLWDRRGLYAGIEYRNEIRHRPVILASPHFSPASWNLLFKADPFDYYFEKGFGFVVAAQLMKQTRVRLSYQDYQQSSEINKTEYSLFSKHKKYRLNPGIVEGKLRSFSTKLTYDSRKRALIKGREAISVSRLFAQLEVGVEVASPYLLDNDFDFVRYYSRLKRTGNTPLPGLTTVDIFVGGSNGTLPPQKYFTVDFSYKTMSDEMSFRTVGERDFTGNRVAAAYLSHDFGLWCFRKSGLPLVRHIPFSLSIRGGIFWTDFKDHTSQTGDDFMLTAHKAYKEIGFSLGRIWPLNYRLDFTWQLSDYDTNRFSINIGFDI